MKLLDKYIISRLGAIGFFALLIFTLSWLAPEIMFRAIQAVSSHKLTVLQGFDYLLYQIPDILTYCLPISTLFASVFLFRQLSLSGELTAILVSGISFRRILLPISIFGLGMSVLFFLTQEVFVPWASNRMRELNTIAHLDEESIVNPQLTFVEKSPTGGMGKFLMISPKATGDQNQFIFLFYTEEGNSFGINRIITATHGGWDNKSGAWELKDGIDYLVNNEGVYHDIERFKQRLVHTSPIAEELLAFPSGDPEEFKLNQLGQYVRLLTRGGQTEDAQFYRVRLYQRYALLLIPLLLAIFGAAIGIERSRATRNLGLTYAAALLLFYNILVPVSTTLGSIGILPPVIAAFIPVLAIIGGGYAVIELRKVTG